MSREEINEAIKIIREPINVNLVEYKYFDQESYEKLLRVYEYCRWFVDNYEQMEQNIENLNHQLQEKNCNWNKLKQFLEKNWSDTQDIWYIKIINKMNDLDFERKGR